MGISNWMLWKKLTHLNIGLCAFTKSKTILTEEFSFSRGYKTILVTKWLRGLKKKKKRFSNYIHTYLLPSFFVIRSCFFSVSYLTFAKIKFVSLGHFSVQKKKKKKKKFLSLGLFLGKKKKKKKKK